MSGIKSIALAKMVGGGGEPGDITVQALNVSANGKYTAPSGKAYSPVNVNVAPALESLTVTQNGSYSPSSGTDGFSGVLVTVSSTPNLQSKTVTQNGTVTPDAGYDGLSEVVVNVTGGGNVYLHSVTLTQHQFIAKAIVITDSDTPFTYDSFTQWLNGNGFNTSNDTGVYPVIGRDGTGTSNNLIGIYYNDNNITVVKVGGSTNTNTFTVADAVVAV